MAYGMSLALPESLDGPAMHTRSVPLWAEAGLECLLGASLKGCPNRSPNHRGTWLTFEQACQDPTLSQSRDWGNPVPPERRTALPLLPWVHWLVSGHPLWAATVCDHAQERDVAQGQRRAEGFSRDPEKPGLGLSWKVTGADAVPLYTE